jgi:uncharacterized protein YhjY with autotransporter beta-barrel domain
MSTKLGKLNTLMLENIALFLEIDGKKAWSNEINRAIQENGHLKDRIAWLESQLNTNNRRIKNICGKN